jgi:hypothetical protein
MIDHRFAAAAATLALHLTIILALLWPAPARPTTDNGAGDVEVRLIPDEGGLRSIPVSAAASSAQVLSSHSGGEAHM